MRMKFNSKANKFFSVLLKKIKYKNMASNLLGRNPKYG